VRGTAGIRCVMLCLSLKRSKTGFGVGRARVRGGILALCLMRLMAVPGRPERFIQGRSIRSRRVILMLLTGRAECLIESRFWLPSTTASRRPGRLLRGRRRSGPCFLPAGRTSRSPSGMD
jgi:hypothetical protein